MQHIAVQVCCAAGPPKIPVPGAALPAHPPSLEGQKSNLVKNLLHAKESSGKTFTQIAEEVGLTNIYTAQLFYNQASVASS